jgi:hypothetical protein
VLLRHKTAEVERDWNHQAKLASDLGSVTAQCKISEPQFPYLKMGLGKVVGMSLCYRRSCV